MNLGDEIGGFHLVRLLGDGSRARVYLGHDGEHTAAIKMFRPTASPESIDDEIAALSSASHAHVVRLRDVGSGPTGSPFLVLERLQSSRLDSVLTRGLLHPGEAVTVLAPVVAALGALHSSGVAHGSLSPRRVLFRATGAPVVTGFGAAQLFVPPTSAAMLSTSRPVLEDRRALGRIVLAVLARVDGESRALRSWVSSLERDGFPDTVIDSMLERIFALAQATPVLAVTSTGATSAMRVAAAGHDAGLRATTDERGSNSTAARSAEPASAPSTVPRIVVAARESMSRMLARGDVGSHLAEKLGPLVESLRTVRRPVWIAAALGVSSLVAALALVPPNESTSAAPPAQSSSAPVGVQTAAPTGVVGDDPVIALVELLTARDRCVRDLSILCLESVDQSGSAAMDDDVALIRSVEAGATTGATAAVDAASVTVVERHGDAALVSYTHTANSEPASALLVKGEAGWRIRDYLAG